MFQKSDVCALNFFSYFFGGGVQNTCPWYRLQTVPKRMQWAISSAFPDSVLPQPPGQLYYSVLCIHKHVYAWTCVSPWLSWFFSLCFLLLLLLCHNSLILCLNSRTAVGRGRAWLYLALMQKKLADYLKVLIDNKHLLRYFITYLCLAFAS